MARGRAGPPGAIVNPSYTDQSVLLRILAVVFGSLLTLYSVSWMVLIRQESAIELGFEGIFRPGARRADVVAVAAGGPAARAGLQPGDRIVSIDGRPLTGHEPLLDLRRHGSPGQHVELLVERAGAQVPIGLALVPPDEVPRSANDERWRNPDAALRLLQQILTLYPIPFLVVALVVVLQRPHDPHAWLLALMLGGFIASAPMADFEYRVPAPLRGPLLAFWLLLSLPLPAVTYAFSAVFPARTPLDRRVPWLKTAGLALAGAAAVWLAALTLAGGGSTPLWALAERLGDSGGLLGLVAAVYNFGFFGLAFVSLGLNAFGPPDVRRKTRVILFGVLVGLVPVMLMQVFVLLSGRRLDALSPWFWALSVLLLFAVPVSLGYAVVRHRAMEIPVLLRRSARYLIVRRGLITAAVVAGLGATGLVAWLFTALPGLTEADRTRAAVLAGSLFGGLLVLAGRRVWLPVMERLDRAFFRGAYDARRLLVTLAEQSRTATDRGALAELIDHSIDQALHPQTLLVFLRGRDESTYEAAEHEGLSGDAATLPASTTQVAELARRGRPLVLEPAQLAPAGAWASFAGLGPEVLVPLVGRSRQLEGVLLLGPRLSEEPYAGEDISLLASLGTQAGLALENIRLAETMAERLEAERRVAHEMEIAREVQAKLLPQERPALETLDYAGVCLQARLVGGDYFDFVSFAPGRFGLVLADISGKGISAALLMASLQANLRAHYGNAPHDLTRVLAVVNKVFYDSTAANHYATLFFGVYDESRRHLTYANCGHLPPILLRADGCLERLETTAPVVGLFETPWACGTGAVDLRPDDTLVVFTDGVSEAASDDGEEFGEERLIALVRDNRHLTAPGLLDAIVRAVREHSAQEQFDDLTLIVGRAR